MLRHLLALADTSGLHVVGGGLEPTVYKGAQDCLKESSQRTTAVWVAARFEQWSRGARQFHGLIVLSRAGRRAPGPFWTGQPASANCPDLAEQTLGKEDLLACK